jgi:hypothetical protein
MSSIAAQLYQAQQLDQPSYSFAGSVLRITSLSQQLVARW